MGEHMEQSILCAEDGPAVRVTNRQGRGPFVLVCEHASNRLPKSLSNLVTEPELLEVHVAWDPGAEAVSQLLSEQLDAPLIAGGYSRLVYDVNRPVDSPQAIVVQSEGHDIAGNRELSAASANERANALYHPFHREISALLEQRAEEGLETALVSIHSFTPVFLGVRREIELGILHDDDSRLADALLAAAPSFTSLKVARNQPYSPEDGVTHTLRRHAIPRGLPNAMIEIRNDLLRTEEQRQTIATSVSAMLRAAIPSAIADRGGPALRVPQPQVTLPWEDIEVAVQTGELDGIGWSGITEDYTVGWADVTNYFLTNNISGAWIGHFFANQAKWDELSDKLKTMLRVTFDSSHYYRQWWYWGGEADLRVNGTKLKLTSIPDADWAKVEAEAHTFWDEIASESETKAKVVKILKDYNAAMEKAGRPYRYT